MSTQEISDYKTSPLISYASYNPSTKDPVLKDLIKMEKQGRIVTYFEHDKTTKNNKDFIEDILLPVFQQLYEEWRDGYNLLIKSKNFFIRICEYPDKIFNTKTIANIKRAAVTRASYPDSPTVLINKYYRRKDNVIHKYKNEAEKQQEKKLSFSDDFLQQIIYHELMHAISQLAVKDKPPRAGFKKEISCLSAMPNINKELESLKIKYQSDLDKAFKELDAEDKKGLKADDFNDICKIYTKMLDKFGCWAYRRIEIGDDTTQEEYLRQSSYCIHNKEEYLAWYLAFLYGNRPQRERIEQRKPDKYREMENKIMKEVRLKVKKTLMEIERTK